MLRISYELNSALRYRRKARIFGNIDNNIRELSESEVLGHELNKIIPKMKDLFERADTFYRMLK